MKNFFRQIAIHISIFALGFLLIVPIQTFAVQTQITELQRCGDLPQGCTWENLVIFANQALQFLFFLASLLAVVSISYAGWLYLSSAGDSGKVKKAHDVFGKVVIGIVFMFTAWLIVNFILAQLGVKQEYKLLIGK